jgi:antitoxin component YwqK of YwqJK toxin-antitoxin module
LPREKDMENKPHYLVLPSELNLFKAGYGPSFQKWSSDGTFWVTAWVSEIHESGIVKCIVADKKPDIIIPPQISEIFTKRTRQDDEMEKPSRQDTLWGDLKRGATIAAREIKHKVEDLRKLPPINLVLYTEDRFLLSRLTPGEIYRFRISAPKSRPFESVLQRPVWFAAAQAPDSNVAMSPYSDFVLLRKRARKLKVFIAVSCFSVLVVMCIAMPSPKPQPLRSIANSSINVNDLNPYRGCPTNSTLAKYQRDDGWHVKTCLVERKGQAIRIGYRILWFENGRVRLIENLSDNGLRTGESRVWHENGQLASVTNWARGRMEGLTIDYDEYGNRIFEAEYRYGAIFKVIYTTEPTQPNGTFVAEKYPSGQVFIRKTFQDNMLVRIVTYYKNGKVASDTKMYPGESVATLLYEENGNQCKESVAGDCFATLIGIQQYLDHHHPKRGR